MINKGKMSKVVYPRGRQGQDRMDKWKVEREQSINKINWNLKQPEQHKVFCSSWLTMSESLKSYSLLLASLFKHSVETEEWQLMVKMCQLWTITVINSSLSVLRTSLVAQWVKNPPTMRETWVRSLGWEDPLEGYPLQYPGLENSMDCIVRGVAKSQTQLSNSHLTSLQCPPYGIKDSILQGSVYFRWGWTLSFFCEKPALADAWHFLPSTQAQKMERMHGRFHTTMGGKRRTREDGPSAPFSLSFRKYLTFLVLIRKTTLVGRMGREMGGRFRREGIWIYLWLILADVWQKTTQFCKAIILQLKE